MESFCSPSDAVRAPPARLAGSCRYACVLMFMSHVWPRLRAASTVVDVTRMPSARYTPMAIVTPCYPLKTPNLLEKAPTWAGMLMSIGVVLVLISVALVRCFNAPSPSPSPSPCPCPCPCPCPYPDASRPHAPGPHAHAHVHIQVLHGRTHRALHRITELYFTEGATRPHASSPPPHNLT